MQLLRSASAPILSSFVPEGDLDYKLFEHSHHHCPLLYSRGLSSKHMPSMRRAACSETDLQSLAHSLTEGEDRICPGEKLSIIQEKEDKRLNPLLMASGMGVSSNAEDLIMNLDAGVHGCDGGRGGSVGDGGLSSNPHDDSNTADLYYQKLLHSDPQNPLFLRNYAQFLSEAKHDHKKSEEYYERAILACPNDGEVLSKYAKHVWDVHRDSERASSYFDQAVKATPEDCYVLASYASFLWQSEEDEEDTNKVMQMTFPSLHGTCAAPSPLMASA